MSGVGGIGGGAGGLQQIMALRQQIIDRSQLLQQVRTPASGAAEAVPEAPANGFTSALKSALDNVNAVQENASKLSEGYDKGEVTDIAKVMLARQEAGVAFEATLQVRNKLLTAYQDIMRMGV
ncbi:flagellar hook-basal body complex protein FliE [Novosphingobium sp. AAP93]|uniref:flagellar hook-basal body complex protein FliE n=1 Tax=Novosphingobium sp. AAP93 TaxID=1523427 RepID=UPI0006B89E28|nr:flagellar hook-basal body complex protein FliE [Novosphingobium sp. AAP93]KPF87536.1 flagellar hook-basal body protein FliE [Novosphingobium sp. AAP93]